MKIKRIIAAILFASAAFYGASWLHGNEGYLKELTATTMLRGMFDDVRSKIEDRGQKAIALKFEGDASLTEEIRKEIPRYEGVIVDETSPLQLLVSATESNEGIAASLKLKDRGALLVDASKSMRLPNWTSILPALTAIIFAICTRMILSSLTLAIFLGALLHYSSNPFVAAYHTAVDYVWKNFVGEFSLLILAFVFVLVGMVNVINRGGGTAGVVNLITKIARSARTACLSACCLGTAIFFDDYTNCIVVGTTMRNFTDKMRVSREKLSYIVDATSAADAGVWIISTWIGFEVMQLQSVSNFLGINVSGYSLFLHALPYRFYCFFVIFFTYMMSAMRRDFGPMLTAERRAALKGEVLNPESNIVEDSMLRATYPKPGVPERWYNAAIPVFVVLSTIFAGILLRGSYLVKAKGAAFSLFSVSGIIDTFLAIGSDGDTLFIIMLIAALAGSLATAGLCLGQKILTIGEIIRAWLNSWKIVPAAVILILAWSIRQVCDDLGTALFLSSLLKDVINPILLPIAIFLLSSAVSFATGTSFGTMGLLLPTVGPLAYALGNPLIFFISIGSVLDGAIFGDHCSPVSDTTILSAMSSSCELTDHVRTQLPYALLCMAVAGLCGYIPAAYGLPVVYTYFAGFAVIVLWLLVVGRNPEKTKAIVKDNATSTSSCKIQIDRFECLGKEEA